MIRPVQTQIFAVIGTPIKHSLSPLMMNEAFRVLGLNAMYLALEVHEPKKGLETLFDAGFSGLSVTIPHKETVFSLVDVEDEASKDLGAVNTLKRCSDRWVGRNTDWIGIVESFKRRGISVAGKRALVIGAGGAARSAVYAAKAMKMDVTITNRTVSRAVELGKHFDCDVIGFEEINKKGISFDVIFQTTPAGMTGYMERPELPSIVFNSDMIVMDFVYNPLITDFLQHARSKGCIIITGLEMLLYQGVAQFEWWFRRKAPVYAMKRILFKSVGVHDHG